MPTPAAAPTPVHRVECQNCPWVGYRRNPTSRDCPACGVDRTKLQPVWLAGCAPHRGRCAYIIHIWPPANPPADWVGYRHAAHYCGFTTDMTRRWRQHLAGGYDPETHRNNGKGARLLAAALAAGCTIELVRVWYGPMARRMEQQLKQRRKAGSLRAGAARSLRPLCPVCDERAHLHYPALPTPPPAAPPSSVRAGTADEWNADLEWDKAFPHLA